MKRYLCRHCGLALDTYAELQRHVESHSTPSVNEHSYSIAPSIATPPSNRAKKTKYSCKCDATFVRWDHLQRHVRTACRLTKKTTAAVVYTCAKCGRNFVNRYTLTRHARTPCIKPPPPPPKRSNAEDTTSHHPLVTDEDPVDPPARLPFADTLSTELLDVVRAHWSTIRTRVTRGLLQCRYD